MNVPPSRRRRRSPILATAIAFGLSAVASLAANLKIEAKLIWATNENKSPDASHKPVDAATVERLRKHFKWKNYFVVTNMVKDIPSRMSAEFPLSKKCTVVIKELEGPRVEATFIGEGKAVHKTVKPLDKSEPIVYLGDDKNETAWFVIVSELEQK